MLSESAPLSSAITIPPPSTAPVVVEPSTTLDTTPESTVPETVVIPTGATDLGYGVYVPAADGLDVSGDGPYTLSSEASGNDTILQVRPREVGEDPNVLI